MSRNICVNMALLGGYKAEINVFSGSLLICVSYAFINGGSVGIVRSMRNLMFFVLRNCHALADVLRHGLICFKNP